MPFCPEKPMVRSRLLIAALLFSAAAAHAAVDGHTVIIPRGQDGAYDEYHYAPAVRVGDMVIVSGIPAGPGATYDERIKRMFERLKKTLEAAGATMADVVEIQTFHRDVTDTPSFQAEFTKFLAIHGEYFKNGFPAWTAVGTTALLAPDSPVEMRVLAVIGAGKSVRVERASAAPSEKSK
jgi:enamine deaminase RidA (YjgF/YER057c/UK114 family)